MKNRVLIAVAALLAVAGAVRAHTRLPPNIVLILADDMGYGDVRALNPGSKIPTPNLDRLAAGGMTFTDAHSPSAVCTPTRYGIITGRYCWRTSLKSGVLDGYGEPLIEPDRPTVASWLKSARYHTGVVGKWHLGLRFAKDEAGGIDYALPVTGGPDELGFDYSHIIPASLDFPPYVFIENGRVTSAPTLKQEAQPFPAFVREGPRSPDFVLEDVLDHLLDHARAYLNERAKESPRPFFLYMPLTAPHKPTLPHPRFRGATDLGPYADFIVQTDWTVGEIIRTLEETGLLENTLLIYTSDNGSYMFRRDAPDAKDHVDDPQIQAYRADRHRANHVYRGTKADIREAGHRVPFLAHWPARIKAGARSDATVCLTDLFATLAALAHAPAAPPEARDSFSFAGILTGETTAFDRPPVIHHSVAGMFAIREGGMKLVLGNGSGGRESPAGKPFEKPYELFDLAADPSESRPLGVEHVSTATGLERAAMEIIDGPKRKDTESE